MAKRYSIAEARSNLRAVERTRAERTGFADAYRQFLKVHRLSEVGLDELEIASTRDRSAGRKVAL